MQAYIIRWVSLHPSSLIYFSVITTSLSPSMFSTTYIIVGSSRTSLDLLALRWIDSPLSSLDHRFISFLSFLSVSFLFYFSFLFLFIFLVFIYFCNVFTICFFLCLFLHQDSTWKFLPRSWLFSTVLLWWSWLVFSDVLWI